MGADTGVSKEPWGYLTGLSQPRTKSMNSVIRFVGSPGPPLMVAPFPLLWHSYVAILCPPFLHQSLRPEKLGSDSFTQRLNWLFPPTSFILTGDQTWGIILLHYNYITIHNYIGHQQASGGITSWMGRERYLFGTPKILSQSHSFLCSQELLDTCV